MNFSELMYESSKFLGHKIANQLLENPQYLEAAFETIEKQIPQISNRTTYVLQIYDNERPEDIIPYYDRILKNIEQLEVEGIKRSFLKIFTRRYNLLNEEQDGKLIDLCFKFLNSSSESIASKMYSMEILFYMTQKYPELRNELISTIEFGFSEGSPAYKSRAKQYLNKMMKSKKY